MNTITNDTIRDRIFNLLDERNIPQNEFAEKLGISPQTVTDWKKGKSRSFSKMISEISRILGVPSSGLLGDTDIVVPDVATYQVTALLRRVELMTIEQYQDLVQKADEILNDDSHSIQNETQILINAYNSADPRAKEMVRLALAPWLPTEEQKSKVM